MSETKGLIGLIGLIFHGIVPVLLFSFRIFHNYTKLVMLAKFQFKLYFLVFISVLLVHKIQLED